VFDDVEWRVRAVRRHAFVDSTLDRVVRQLVQHALRHAERADALLDHRPSQRHRRLHALYTADLPPRRHRRRPRLPLDENLLHLRRQRRYVTCVRSPPPFRDHFEGESMWNAVRIVEKLPKPMETALPLLKCLRTHDGRHCGPFSGQKMYGIAGVCVYKISTTFFPRLTLRESCRSAPGAWTRLARQLSHCSCFAKEPLSPCY